MKKEKLKLKDMDQYVNHSKLNMQEAIKVFEMEGDGARGNDIPFVYLAMKTIKGLANREYDVTKLPKVFLTKFSTMTFDDAANLVNIMFFKEDLEMNDIYKAVKTFYEFFNTNIDFQSERLNAIRDYIFMDNNMLDRIYRAILMIDINLLTFNDDMKFFDYYNDKDIALIKDNFENNKIKFDEKFNKNLFKAQLSYVKYYYNEVLKGKQNRRVYGK